VPAGTFEALRVNVDLTIRFASNQNWRQYTYWYSEKVKRVVKVSHRNRTGGTQAIDYDVELLSYKLH